MNNYTQMQYLRQLVKIRDQIVQQITATRYTDTDVPWRINEDFSIFIDQPYLCAKCKEIIPNDHTYIVYNRLFNIYRYYEGDQHTSCTHPHVGSGRAICLGFLTRTPDAAAEALFTNHDPTNTYSEYKEWLKRIGHSCSRAHADKVVCAHCDDEMDSDNENWYGWSEAIGDSVCYACHSELTITCYKCDDIHYNDSDDMIYIESIGENWCQSCADRYLAYCSYCEEYHREIDIAGHVVHIGNVCTSCFDDNNHIEACAGCSDIFPVENLAVGEGGDNFCRTCIRKYPAEEPEDEEEEDAT